MFKLWFMTNGLLLIGRKDGQFLCVENTAQHYTNKYFITLTTIEIQKILPDYYEEFNKKIKKYCIIDKNNFYVMKINVPDIIDKIEFDEKITKLFLRIYEKQKLIFKLINRKGLLNETIL